MRLLEDCRLIIRTEQSPVIRQATHALPFLLFIKSATSRFRARLGS